jgi:hypothetical protein
VVDRCRRWARGALGTAGVVGLVLLALSEVIASNLAVIGFIVTIPEVVIRFGDVGVPRAARTIQTYCKSPTGQSTSCKSGNLEGAV